MNSTFESPDGVVSVQFPDSTPRPRLPIQQAFFVGRLSAEFSDFALGWLPTYTDRPPTHVPARPARIGMTNVFTAGIAPMAWEPHYPLYRDAPRLHRTFGLFGFDPLTGAGLVVAQRMAWDPRQHPIVVRPRLRETTAFFYQPPPEISAGSLTCTAIADVALTTPTFLAETFSTPRIGGETVTVPTLLDEGAC